MADEGTGGVQRRTVKPPRPHPVDWLAGNTLAAVSIVGALVYGITRIAYVGFYGEFGLDPEDVGIGYAAMLARVLPGLLVWAALFALGMLAWMWLTSLGDSRSKRWGIVGVITLLLFVTAPLLAQGAASRVKRGDELRAPSGVFSWGILRDPLGFTVREVGVEWVDGDTSAHSKLGKSLMLLGSDSDVYYLYDVDFKRTVRVPRSLVIVREDIG